MKIKVDGKELELNIGDICLINQRHHHQIFNKKNHSCLRKSVIFDPFALIREERIISSYLDPMLKDPSLNYIMMGIKSLYLDFMVETIKVIFTYSLEVVVILLERTYLHS